jgi:Tail-tube assembly protein
MATEGIASGPMQTPVGTAGTKLETYTETRYNIDSNGNIDPKSVKTEILYNNSTIPGVKNWVPAAASTDGGKTWDTTSKRYQKLDGTPVFSPEAQKSLKEGALRTTTNQQIQIAATKAKLKPEQTKVLSDAAKNNASDTEREAAKNKATIEEELSEENVRERKKGEYKQVVKYPEKLNLEYQDCIKFSMLKYQQSGLNVTVSDLNKVKRSVLVNKEGIPTVGGRVPITTIILPIPGGISDSNGVDWQGNELDEITKAFAGIAQGTITGGGEGLQKSATETKDAAQQNISGLQQTVASKFVQSATGASGIMQRQYGAIINPNIELLFNGPQLRTFSFIFKLSPRSATEAKEVQRIIRYFKQGMTPKRSKGYLLLQSPHTFAISYLTSNKEHPYLNRFKECALTQCNVNYTPDGNYMSFNGTERSMTSYELTLQFQELVPLFDDDYGNKDDNIGF